MRVPIRIRLILPFALGMAGLLVLIGSVVYVELRSQLGRSIDAGLRSRAEVLVAGMGQNGAGFADSPGELVPPGETFAQVLGLSGRVVVAESSPQVASAATVPARTLAGIRGPAFLDETVPGLGGSFRVLVVPSAEGAGKRYVVVGASLAGRDETLRSLLVLFAIGGPLALALLSLAAWLLAGAALRPVEQMRSEASAISASEPDRRLPVPDTGDDLARLASTLNGMLTRLQDARESERRFVDDASHELRTPLAILKGELDVALSRPRRPEEMAAALHRAAGETDRLVRLAEDLLVLSRTEGGRLPVVRADVRLLDLVERVCSAYQARAHADGILLRCVVEGERSWVDPVRVRQALDNLVDNALRATPRGGEVLVRAAQRDGGLTIEVKDTGPGFPAALLEHAAEPFVRGERGADAPGAGLGLTIVQAVAEAHGGSLAIHNRPTGGAVVTLSGT